MREFGNEEEKEVVRESTGVGDEVVMMRPIESGIESSSSSSSEEAIAEVSYEVMRRAAMNRCT